MSIDKRTIQVADWAEREEQEGRRLDPGPHIGIVKENRDPLLNGRIQVWIPEFGGIETDPKYWRTVSYAGPYLGSTVQEPFAQESPKSGASDKNTFTNVRHTYGMWFNVPDLENWVLCTFAGGDPARGYWFACVLNQLGHHMIPAIGSSKNIVKPSDSKLAAVIRDGEPYPVVEFNEYSQDVNWSNIQSNKKPVHESQLKILLEQGLDRYSLTKTKGIIESTSQRETPSGVFGFSTPGRPVGGMPSESATSQQRKIKARMGGHSLVLDDGNKEGKNNLIRLRSAGGHQILLDDSERVVYISNSSGSVYIEMSAAGHLNIYSSNSINLRTKAEFNFHADGNMNVNVGGSFNLNAKGSINLHGSSIEGKGSKDITLFGGSLKLGSSGRLDLYTSGGGSFTASQGLSMSGKTIGLNSGPGPTVSKPRDLSLKSSADTKKDSNGQWQVEENKIKSIATIVPTHEPWSRKAGVASQSSNAVQDTENDGSNLETTDNPDEIAETGQVVNTRSITHDSDGTMIQTEDLDPGAAEAVDEYVEPEEYATKTDLLDEDAVSLVDVEEIGPLEDTEVQALMVQSAHTLSETDYGYIASDGAVGAYAFDYKDLANASLISRASIEQFVNNPMQAISQVTSWTGKDGIKSLEQFLSDPAAQARVMVDKLKTNYQELVSCGGLSNLDSNGTVGAMLNLSHTTSPLQARDWRKTGGELLDRYGNSAAKLYKLGGQAVSRLGRGP